MTRKQARPVHDGPKRCVAYVRVSDQAQAEEGTTSLDEQELKCRSYAAGKTDPAWDMVGVYREEGISGTLADRPAWTRLMVDAQAGQFQVVICLTMSRFTRDEVLGYMMLDGLANLGVELWMTDTGRVDPDDDNGSLTNGVFMLIASWQRKSLLRTMAGGAHGKVRDGRWPSSPQAVPFGYCLDRPGEDDKARRRNARLAQHPDESETIRRAAVLVLDEGKSLAETCNVLNAEGRLPRGMLRKVDGETIPVPATWNLALLRRHLTRPALVGEIYWGAGRMATGKYGAVKLPGVPAVLTPERFRALGEAVTVHGPRGRTETVYSLSGRIASRCQEGRHFNGIYRSDRDLRSYKCSGKRGELGVPACSCRWLDADPIEDRVWSEVCDLLENPDRLRNLAREYLAIDSGRKVSQADELAALDERIGKLEGQLSAGVTAYLRAGLDPEAMATAVGSLQTELATLRQRRDDITRHQASTAAQAGDRGPGCAARQPRRREACQHVPSRAGRNNPDIGHSG